MSGVTPMVARVGLEAQLVGALLAGEVPFDRVPQELSEDHFTTGTLRRIFRAQRELHEQGQVVRDPQVIALLQKKKELSSCSWESDKGAAAVRKIAIAESHRAVPHVPGLARAILAAHQEEQRRKAGREALARFESGEDAQTAFAPLFTFAANDAGVPRLVSRGVDHIFAPLGPVPWLVPTIKIAPGRPTMIAGYGFSGKTVAAQEIALSVATGKSVFGVYTCRKGPVKHVDFEQGSRLTFERYQRLARAKGITPADLAEQLQVVVYPPLSLADATAEQTLLREAEGHALVIVDSLTCALPGVDENSPAIAGPLYMLGRVSEKTGAVFLVIHHARKPQENASGGAKMAIRGSSAIFGACDSVYVLTAGKGEPVKVEHVRSPIDGVTVADFGLAIEDVELDGDKRAGLRLRHMEPEQMATKDLSEGQKLEGIKAAILALVAKSDKPLKSANAVLERVEGARTKKLQAFKELVGDGLLVQPEEKGAYRVTKQ